MKRPVRPSLQRWGDVFLVSLAGASVVSLLPGELVGRCDRVGWLDSYRLLVGAPLVVVFLLRLGWERTVPAAGLRHPSRIHHLSWPAPVGFALMLAAIGLSDPVRSHRDCSAVESRFALERAATLGTFTLGVLLEHTFNRERSTRLFGLQRLSKILLAFSEPTLRENQGAV